MIKNAQDNSFFIPSVTYNAVRSRQLEGDYPGDPQTACWPITTLRVRRGWGDVPQEAWPNSALKSWPPYEPPGLDQIAREYRIFRYQRIRTANECWNALRRRCPVMASFEITQQWFDAKDGVIQVPEENAPTVGTHMISIMGAEERFTILPGSERRRFVFDNCWGPDWGIQGRGFLPSELFKRWLVEAWTFDLISPEKEKHNE